VGGVTGIPVTTRLAKYKPLAGKLTIVSASTVICVSNSPVSPGISAIFRLLTCIGTAPIDEMICTDMLGVVLKTGNLNSPCRVRFEVDGPNRTEAVYVYAFSGAELASSMLPTGADHVRFRQRRYCLSR
jgi:hypothetical protein